MPKTILKFKTDEPAREYYNVTGMGIVPPGILKIEGENGPIALVPLDVVLIVEQPDHDGKVALV